MGSPQSNPKMRKPQHDIDMRLEPVDHVALDERIAGLAQELQDNILDFTIAVNDDNIRVTTATKSEPGLQINHRLRERFAKDCYSQMVFTFWGNVNSSPSVPKDSICTLWLTAIQPSHRQHLTTVHLYEERPIFFQPRVIAVQDCLGRQEVGMYPIDARLEQKGWDYFRMLKKILVDADVQLGDGVLQRRLDWRREDDSYGTCHWDWSDCPLKQKRMLNPLLLAQGDSS